MYPMKTTIHCFGGFFLTLFFAVPKAVELSTCIGVGGWGRCISISVARIVTAAWPLRSSATYSDSATDAMMLRNICTK